VGLGIVGDEFFPILPKVLDEKTFLGTLGDARDPINLVMEITNND
jgi:hypothetical protein